MRRVSRSARVLGGVCSLCAALGGRLFAQQLSPLERSLQIRQAQMPSDGEVHVLPVQGNVYMLAGAGGHIVAQIRDEAVRVVDRGTAQRSEKVLAAIRKLSNKPLRYIVNTHFHPDHTGGNLTIGK